MMIGADYRRIFVCSIDHKGFESISFKHAFDRMFAVCRSPFIPVPELHLHPGSCQSTGKVEMAEPKLFAAAFVYQWQIKPRCIAFDRHAQQTILSP